MSKDDSLFSFLDTIAKKKIYVVDNFALDIIGHSDVTCSHGQIVEYIMCLI